MNFAHLAADILLGQYGMSHQDLPPKPEPVLPEPGVDGEYELVNQVTEEVELVTVLTAKQAKNFNLELAAEHDDRRWEPFCAEVL